MIGAERTRSLMRAAARLRRRLTGRTVWQINSTARGGGVAEMLHSLLAYTRGAGIDVRWLVIDGDEPFFQLTKRLHNALHGWSGDGEPPGEADRACYERTLLRNAGELAALVRPGDVAILHDPQTAGLVPYLARLGARVVWRCHIGADRVNAQTEGGWAFLLPYLARADRLVFSRESYVPREVDPARVAVIAPSIDPFSAKNQDLDADSCRAILVHTGLVEGPAGGAPRIFARGDGSPGRVDRCADVQSLGRAPSWDEPLVVQVSRWDRLKDPIGVMRGFVRMLEHNSVVPAHLVLAGPNVHAVADDPEGARVFDEVEAAWRGLPHARRRRVHLASLPMADLEENATIVNALQRHARVVVQKSLAEGFGLTVAEAMWKARPVLASAVGGIQDQIEHGVSGLLLKDPADLDAFAASLRTLFDDRAGAERLGARARERVQERYLVATSLLAYAQLIEAIDA